MKKIFVKLTVNAILHVDEGVTLSDYISESEVLLENDDNRVDVIDCQIENYQVMDSK